MKGCCCWFDGIIRDMPGPWTQGQGCGCGINHNWFLFYPSSNVCSQLQTSRRYSWPSTFRVEHASELTQTNRQTQVLSCASKNLSICLQHWAPPVYCGGNCNVTTADTMCGTCCERSGDCWLHLVRRLIPPDCAACPDSWSACCYLGPLDGQVRRTAGQNRFLTARLDTNNF